MRIKMNKPHKNPLILIISIALLYTTWSSTYLAIRVAVRTIPPLLMTSSRFIIAGALMYILALIRKEKQPSLKQLFGGSVVGILLFLASNGLLCYAEQTVNSGLSAVVVSSGAFWICLFSGFSGKWPSKIEWLGIGIGFTGIIVLNSGAELKGNPVGGMLLLISSMIWAFGSVLTKKLPVPSGFMGTGIEMFSGGLASLIAALIIRQDFNIKPSGESIAALIYLIVVGAMVGFSAFMYVFHNARPALASSYSYVNNVGAVLLGVLLLGEKVNAQEIIALFIVVAGVAIIATSQARPGISVPAND
jgi:drug/metabolite transporter (DMT)-like permease